MMYVYGNMAVAMLCVVSALYGTWKDKKWFVGGAMAMYMLASAAMTYLLFSWTSEGFQAVGNNMMQLYDMMMSGGKS